MMIDQKKTNTSWGNNTKTFPKIFYPENNLDILRIFQNTKNFVIQGNGRSYGDVCLNKKNVISARKLNKIIHFDKKRGVIKIQAGVLLKDLLEHIIPFGWFIPTTPGTKYVTIGGMIANNIHGKNVKKNSIKYYIKNIKLIKTNKKIITCSSKKNKKIFDLTVGGFGLTGFIINADIQLKKISSQIINQKIIEFKNYDEFYSIYKENIFHEYAVSWIESFDNNKIKGLHFFGNHSKIKDKKRIKFKEKKIFFFQFLILKLFIKNYYLSKIMNLVFKYYKKFFYQKNSNINNFFYPQDHLLDWNKAYGSDGFFQIQFIVEKNNFESLLNNFSKFFKKKKVYSCFIVIKKLNEKGKFLNYFGNGYSISFDFPVDKNFGILKKYLNQMIKKYNLRINLSKDLVTKKSNMNTLKEYRTFCKNIKFLNKNKKLNSIFSDRLGF